MLGYQNYEEFTWYREDLTNVSPVCGTVGPVKGSQHWKWMWLLVITVDD